MKSTANDALLGRTIADKFRIESLIGSGAMGAVYRAKQIALDKTVALKVMHGDLAKDDAFAERFHREARAASRLDHPNSVRVLDFGVADDGLLYIAMEYLPGKDLLAVMREEWPLPGDRIIDILMQTLSALTLAHDSGIVHRDLKPENIMILRGADDEGRPRDVVKVCDFGIAKLTNDRSGTNPSLMKGPLTSAGAVVGTPEYMSPEQGRGDALDARSDLYSVGVILFHMLTGKVPFTAENAIGIILKHVTDDPPRPTSIAPQVDRRLETICLKAMRKKREERYPSAREMRADLRAVREQVRGPLPSEESLPDVSHLDAVTAVTVNDSPRARMESAAEARGTATGTALASQVAKPKGAARGWVLGVAAAALLLGVGGTVIVTMRSKRPAAPPPAVATVAPTATDPRAAPPKEPSPPSPTPSPPSATPSAAPPPEPPTVAHAPAPPRHHGGREHAPSSPSRATPPAPVAVAPASSSLPIAPAPQAAEEPTYDATRATVAIGSVVPNNVNGEAVRAAVSGAGLTKCYRDALRARGRRTFGAATLNLSIDESGRVKGAILTGADWLPEMTRCVQGSAAGLQLRPGAVETGGGTAEVWLSFRAP